MKNYCFLTDYLIGNPRAFLLAICLFIFKNLYLLADDTLTTKPTLPLAIEFVNTTGEDLKSLISNIKLEEMTSDLILRKNCCQSLGSLKKTIKGLEAETASFVRGVNQSGAPPIQCLLPSAARAVLESIQNIPVTLCPSTRQDVVIRVCDHDVLLNIIRPLGSTGTLPIIMYFHGGGWELGDEFTHSRLIRQLSSGAHAALVFVNYTRTPEAQFPVAITEAFEATKYIAEHASEFNLDASRLAVAGDSVGGNMATVISIMAKENKGPSIIQQVLFYPVTQACFDTFSYKKYACGLWLTRAAMMHYWNIYQPNVELRNDPFASPLKASFNQLRGLPPTLVISPKNDVLFCDGYLYAHKLRKAGVAVRGVIFDGTIHDFVMLNSLANTPPTQAAICLAQATLRRAFGT